MFIAGVGYARGNAHKESFDFGQGIFCIIDKESIKVFVFLRQLQRKSPRVDPRRVNSLKIQEAMPTRHAMGGRYCG